MITQLDYCQYLLSSPFNYTQTYFADHVAGLSHDRLNRLLQKIDVQAEDLWESVQESLVVSPDGYLVFDDTVLDKRHSFKIGYVKSQWSGNEHKTIKGIGVVTCVYVNPDTEQFWAIDYRLYNRDIDGKSKLDHVKEMLDEAIENKKLSFKAVLMDSWYAKRKLMVHIGDVHKKFYYAPIDSNRLIAEHRGEYAYQRVDTLDWTEEELEQGKRVRLNDFPREHKVQLFRVPVSASRTDLVVTNDVSQDDRKAVRQVCKKRWKIEEFHRELKQLTGIESCQCRKEVIQRNHIGCAMLVWARLKNLAYQTGRNVYDLWKSQYDQMIARLFQSPIVTFA